MGKAQNTNSRGKGKFDGRELKRRQEKAAATLDKLKHKITKIKTHQKKMRRQGKQQHTDHLTLARHLRRVERETKDWLVQFQKLREGGQQFLRRLDATNGEIQALGGRLEGVEARTETGEPSVGELAVRADNLDALTGEIQTLDDRLEGVEARAETGERSARELAVRADSLEALTAQIAERAEVLEQQIGDTRRAFDGFVAETRNQAASTLAAAVETAINGDGSGIAARGSFDAQANVLEFKKVAEAQGLESEDGDREAEAAVATKLEGRLDILEDIAADLEEHHGRFGRTLEALQTGFGQVEARHTALEQRVDQDKQEVRLAQQELASRAVALDAAVEELQSRAEPTFPDLAGLTTKNQNLVSRLDELAGKSGQVTEFAWALDGRVEDLALGQATQAGDLEKQREEVASLREVQGALQGGIEEAAGLARTLDGRTEDLASGQAAQAAHLGQQRTDVASLREEQGDLKGRIEEAVKLSESLTAGIVDLGATNAALEQRIDHRERAEAAFEQQTQGLEGRLQRQASRYNRLFGGMAAGLLLLLGLGAAAFWSFGGRVDQQAELVEGKISYLRQETDDQRSRLAAQEKRLVGLETDIVLPKAYGERLDRVEQKLAARNGSLQGGSASEASFEKWVDDLQGKISGNQAAITELAMGQQELLSQTDRLVARMEVLGKAKTASSRRGDDLLGPAWLRERNPRHFTIQLVAAYGPQVVSRVTEAFAAPGARASYTGQHLGRDWHVLLYGDYPSLAEAEEAMAGLPAEIQAFGPWARRFREVQGDLSDEGKSEQ